MIHLRGVSKSFNMNGNDTKVIDNISLSVHDKEIFGLVGDTGSGKSTLLRMMNGFMMASDGSVSLMGETLNETNRHELVKETSMIFQNFNLLSNLNVLENVLLPMTLRKKDKAKSILKAKELLSFVGLTSFENSYIKTLSGGQKQRVAIARTLMSNPKVILCDEPTSALDPSMSYEVLKLLKDINETMGTTIVIVSHNISVIKSICDRTAVLENGKIQTIVSLKNEGFELKTYEELLTDV